MDATGGLCAFVPVRIDGRGMILDPGAASILREAIGRPSPVTDLFIFTHGWWTNAALAMAEAKHFSVEFTHRLLQLAHESPLALRSPASSLALGIHWPAMLSDTPHALVNVLEVATFYSMEKRADIVGETGVSSLAELIYRIRIDTEGALRVHVLGHSFGCRVVCAALCVALRAIAQELGKIPPSIILNVALLQAAFDHDSLEQDKKYGMLCHPDVPLRLLATRSEEDLALVRLYRDAERPMHFLSKFPGVALGAAGPSPKAVADFGGKDDVIVTPGLTYAGVTSKTARLIVADLTPLHREYPSRRHPFCGHHSDIFSDEIYHLLAGFLFRP